jgi:antitoxin (DNA-binding transcriptional repressor) of toxin-antitoxin stability system
VICKIYSFLTKIDLKTIDIVGTVIENINNKLIEKMFMKTVDKTQLKDNLLELLQNVELEGEEIVVIEGTKPVARISPYRKSHSTAELFKTMRGKVRYFEDLTTPTTEEWHGSIKIVLDTCALI